MYSLFIDTHDKDITFALYKDGSVIDTNIKESKRNHGDYTMPMLKEILDNNNINVHELNEILVVNGPGSFTGIRIGITIAKTLAYTLNIPIKTITSLEAFAISNNSKKDKIAVIRDLKGVFGGYFDKGKKLIGELFYKSNDEFKSYIEDNKYEDLVIEKHEYDFNAIYEHMKTVEPTIAHKVNPIYIKVIEALKNDKTSNK